MKEHLSTIYNGCKLIILTDDEMAKITGGCVIKNDNEIGRVPMRCPWNFNKPNKGKMISALKQIADKNVTVQDIINDKLNLIKESENEIEKLAISFIEQAIRRITGKPSPEAVTLDIDDLCRTDSDYWDALYNMGVTLYDKHGIYETGVVRRMNINNGHIKLTLVGCDSDCESERLFYDLEAWAQAAMVDFLASIEKDLAEGSIEVTEKEEGFTLSVKED